MREVVLVKSKLSQIAFLLTLSVILPYGVHLIPPLAGVALGAMLLPMFYTPLIALLLVNLPSAIIIAIFSPLLNSSFTGHPLPEKVAILTVELAVFTVIAYLIQRRKRDFWATALLAYVATGLSVAAMLFFVPGIMPQLSPLEFLLGTVTTAPAGIAILVLINIVLLRFPAK